MNSFRGYAPGWWQGPEGLVQRMRRPGNLGRIGVGREGRQAAQEATNGKTGVKSQASLAWSRHPPSPSANSVSGLDYVEPLVCSMANDEPCCGASGQPHGVATGEEHRPPPCEAL